MGGKGTRGGGGTVEGEAVGAEVREGEGVSDRGADGRPAQGELLRLARQLGSLGQPQAFEGQVDRGGAGGDREGAVRLPGGGGGEGHRDGEGLAGLERGRQGRGG